MDKTEKKQRGGRLFKKGESGNPKGRPKKGYSITEWFKNMLAAEPDVKEQLGRSILEKALKGDPTAVKLIWNYMDGMPKQDLGLDKLGNIALILPGSKVHPRFTQSE